MLLSGVCSISIGIPFENIILQKLAMSHQPLYIVDNSDNRQSVKEYLTQWCQISKQMDIATGYLEIGGLLELDEKWQNLDKIRIILGNEVTRRTKDVIDETVKFFLSGIKKSIDKEQERNEFLVGIPAILDAFKSRKIECRVYNKNKFHAKAYITHFRDDYLGNFIKAMNVPTGYALVGSSNFTKAGLTQNIELNVQVAHDVDQLQNWFDEHWENGEDITSAVLDIIENHVKEFSPYDVYLRSMYEFFKGREETVSEWEQHDSIIFRGLSQYQIDGYKSLVEIAKRYFGAFLCDGVGLGKTFVGLMLIERFVKKERKNVVLIVPASARTSVWEVTINKYIPEILEGFFPFKIINHSDLLLEKNRNLMRQIQEQAEVIIIDEAHHFRNRSSSRYNKLYDIIGNGTRKQLFMLTATPINNSFLDLQHLIELFSQRKADYFSDAPLGIHSLPGHFMRMEKTLKSKTSSDVADAVDITEDIFRTDELVQALVVQRSRAYVKHSLSIAEKDNVVFSHRQDPDVVNYSLRKSYDKLIDNFVRSFYRKNRRTGSISPILALAVYSPYEDVYYRGDITKIDKMTSGRQQQIVNLIRQLLLKRFESSIAAFEETCIRIYFRLYTFLNDYKEYGNVRTIQKELDYQSDVIDYVEQYIKDTMLTSLEELEDDLPEYVWEDEPNLSPEDFNIDIMLDDTLVDMNVLADFIRDIKTFDSSKDDKIINLRKILSEDTRLKNRKVIIFTEYRTTAKYIYKELLNSGFTGVYEVDGKTKENKHDIVVRFSPYYNGSCSQEVKDEIQILIATDVLAEGLNLQDASCLINYDLHWNPVRLMQRIGRIDRRRNQTIEQKLLSDHPELVKDRENAYYWNFLPPEELESLLNLYQTVSQKTLRISKAFGIEGKKLLTPEDDYEALKDFNSQYEGTESPDELMAIAYHELMVSHPNYAEEVSRMPKKLYSGRIGNKERTEKNKTGIFFCYELPIKKPDGTWSSGDGLYRWYLLEPDSNAVCASAFEIWETIKCKDSEPRCLTISAEIFRIARKEIEKHITDSYMKPVQAPLGVSFRLVTWMQIS